MSRVIKTMVGLLGYLNPMNLPRALFLRYRPTDKPYFGSRFMRFLGNTFMGTPDSKGLGDLRKDLQDTYYHLKVDRMIPNGDADQKEWRIQSIKAQIYREVEHRELGKAIWIGLSVAALVVTFAVSKWGGDFNWGSDEADKEVSQVVAVAGESSEPPSAQVEKIEMDLAGCQRFWANLRANRLTAFERGNYEAIAPACNEFSN